MLDRFMGFLENWPVDDKISEEQSQKKREKALLILDMLKKEEYRGKSHFGKLAVLCAQHNFVPGLEYIAANSKKHLVEKCKTEAGLTIDPFELALFHGAFDAIHYLIRTVNNKPAPLFFNDLQEAVVMNDLAKVKMLKNKKFDKLAEIMLIAVSLNHTEIIKELCQVDFNIIGKALGHALRWGCVEPTTYLVNTCLASGNDEILNQAIIKTMKADALHWKSLVAYIDCICADTTFNPEKRLILLENALEGLLVSDFEYHLNDCAISFRKLLASSTEMPAFLTKIFQTWLIRIAYQYSSYSRKTYRLLVKMYAFPELDSKIMLQSLKKEARFMLLVNTIKTSKLSALIRYLVNVDLLDQTANGKNLAHLAIEEKVDNFLLFYILEHKPELIYEKNSSGLALVDLNLPHQARNFLNPNYKALRELASAFFNPESCRVDLEDSVKWGRIKVAHAAIFNATERALAVLENNSCEREELNAIYSLLSSNFPYALLEVVEKNLGDKQRLLELLDKVYLMFASSEFPHVHVNYLSRLAKLLCYFERYEYANNILEFAIYQEINYKESSMPFVRACEFSFILGLTAQLLYFCTPPSNLDEFIFLNNKITVDSDSSLVGTIMSPFFLKQPSISSIPKEVISAFHAAIKNYPYTQEKVSKTNDVQEKKYEYILQHCYTYLTWFGHFTNISEQEVSLEDRKFYLQVRLSVIESISQLMNLIHKASPGLDKVPRIIIDRQKLEVSRQMEALDKQIQEENSKPVVLIAEEVVKPAGVKKELSAEKSNTKIEQEHQELGENRVIAMIKDERDLSRQAISESANNNTEQKIELIESPPAVKESIEWDMVPKKGLAVTTVEPQKIIEKGSSFTKVRRKTINLYTNVLRLFELLGDAEKYQTYEDNFNAYQSSAQTSSSLEEGEIYASLKKLIDKYKEGVDHTCKLMQQRIVQLGDYTHFLTNERVNLAMSSGDSVLLDNEIYDKETLVKANRENYEKAFEEISEINEKMGRLNSAKQLLANSCLEISDFETFFSQFNRGSAAAVTENRPGL